MGSILPHYYHLEYIKVVVRKMVTGHGYGSGIGGCKRLCCPWMRGMAWLHCFPCLCRLRTGRCISLEASYRFIIPSTYLCMGAWKTCCSLVMDSTLFGPTVRVLFWWRRSLHRTEFGAQERGLRVLVWTGTWTPRTGG